MHYRHRLVVGEAVDPHDDLSALLDGLLLQVGTPADGVLKPAPFHRPGRAAHAIDLVDQAPGLGLDPVGE
jgi:hypothetical protein